MFANNNNNNNNNDPTPLAPPIEEKKVEVDNDPTKLSMPKNTQPYFTTLLENFKTIIPDLETQANLTITEQIHQTKETITDQILDIDKSIWLLNVIQKIIDKFPQAQDKLHHALDPLRHMLEDRKYLLQLTEEHMLQKVSNILTNVKLARIQAKTTQHIDQSSTCSNSIIVCDSSCIPDQFDLVKCLDLISISQTMSGFFAFEAIQKENRDIIWSCFENLMDTSMCLFNLPSTGPADDIFLLELVDPKPTIETFANPKKSHRSTTPKEFNTNVRISFIRSTQENPIEVYIERTLHDRVTKFGILALLMCVFACGYKVKVD